MSMKATLVSHVAALGPTLHETMATATEKTERAVTGIPHNKFPHQRSGLIRTHWRIELDATPLPLGWTVGGNTRFNGQTLLYQPELNVRMRILKERRQGHQGGVPNAGRNLARRGYWNQRPIPGLEITLPPFDPTNLLLCWDYASRENVEQFQMRVVRPLEAGKYGEAVKCDVMIDIEPGGGIYEHRAFQGSDDPEDFFGSINIDEDANEA